MKTHIFYWTKLEVWPRRSLKVTTLGHLFIESQLLIMSGIFYINEAGGLNNPTKES